MIKQSIKNYFKCLKYVFTPLGIIALGLVCGLSIAIPEVIRAATDMCKKIMDMSGKSIDFEALFSNIVASIRALDWSDPFAATKTIFSKEWFSSAVLSDVNKIIGDAEEYIAQVTNEINIFIDTLKIYAIVVAVFVLVAFIAGFFLTKWMIRRDIAKRTIKKFIVSTLCGSVLSAACAGLGIWLSIAWSGGIYVTVVVAFLLATVFSLLNAYITYGYKKVAFNKIVNVKNIIKLILSDVIIFVFGIIIAIIISLITNIAVGVFVAIGLIAVTVSVMEMTADSYVKELTERSEQAPSSAN